MPMHMRTTTYSRLAIAIAPAALLFTAGTANAATCEEAFVKKGNAITGLRFTAAVTVADLPPAVAIGQLRGLVAAKGYDIMADEAEYGSMLIEQPMTGTVRAFPIQISATQTGGIGTVVMEAKLRAGQSTKADAAQRFIAHAKPRFSGCSARCISASSFAINSNDLQVHQRKVGRCDAQPTVVHAEKRVFAAGGAAWAAGHKATSPRITLTQSPPTQTWPASSRCTCTRPARPSAVPCAAR